MDQNSETMEQANQQRAVKTSKRLMSLDALRGFDMFWIIGGATIITALHNAVPNSVTAFLKVQLEHVAWEGFRFEDIIMPLFLFISGTTMPFSFNKHLASGQSKRYLYMHIAKRVIILWILGLMIQGNLLQYDLSQLHVYSNTLQAIAAGYLFSSIILLQLNIRWQFIITGGLLLLFWALMAWVPVPGYGAGVLTEDGNLAIYIDRLVLGRFDDGLNYTWVLSSMTFTTTVMLGVLAGHLLRSEKTQKEKTIILFVAGIGLLVAGMIWGIWFPIIKRIWTSSFVLYSGGWCYLLQGIFYLVIDVWEFKKWAFGFVVIGMNAIAVYVSAHMFYFGFISNIFVGSLEDRLGVYYGLVHAILTFAIVWLILYWMYRKKTFIKV
jgi:predicted acyltransferase